MFSVDLLLTCARLAVQVVSSSKTHLQFHASTLQLRGSTKLPAVLQDGDGNVLLFNGDSSP